jgi:hypothetical protein
LVVLFLFLCVSPSASAYNACAGIFVNHPEPVVTKSINLAELHPRFSGKLKRWNQMLGNLKVPHLLLELTSDPVTRSQYAAFSNKILVGTRLEGRDISAREKIMAHEFGHSIFNEHFNFRWKGHWIKTKDVAMAAKAYTERKNDPNLIIIQKQIEALKNNVTARQANDGRSWIEKIEQKLAAKDLNDVGNPLEQFNYVYDMLIAYNELFADCLPTLLWHDSRAITEAVEDPYHPFYQLNENASAVKLYRKENDTAPDTRDFTLVRFKDWQHESSDGYTLFDPARGVLWELFMENLDPKDIPLFLETFLEAASVHVSLRLDRNDDIRVSQKASNPTVINQEFIRIFIEVAKEKGLEIHKSHENH